MFVIMLFDYWHHATVTNFTESYICAVCIHTNLYDITIYFVVHQTAPIRFQLFIVPLTFDILSCLRKLHNVGVILAAHCLCCTAGFKCFCCINLILCLRYHMCSSALLLHCLSCAVLNVPKSKYRNMLLSKTKMAATAILGKR